MILLAALLPYCKRETQEPEPSQDTTDTLSQPSLEGHELPFTLNLPAEFTLTEVDVYHIYSRDGTTSGSLEYLIAPPFGGRVNLTLLWWHGSGISVATRQMVLNRGMGFPIDLDYLYIYGCARMVAVESLWVEQEPLLIRKLALFNTATDSQVGGRPAIKALMAYKGIGYKFTLVPDNDSFLASPDTQLYWKGMDWSMHRIAEGLCDFVQIPDTFTVMVDYYYEAIHILLHSRPFWIADADTLGPIDRSSIEYLPSRPLFVPRIISGFPEEGFVKYWADYPEVKTPISCGYRPVTMVTIFWRPALPGMGEDDSLTPGYKERIRRQVYESFEIEWNSPFNSRFKECPVQGFNLEYYDPNNTSMIYRTDLFFERTGFEFQIVAVSDDSLGPRFLSPRDKLWRWLEHHWYWADEPHPDFSRYPIPESATAFPWHEEGWQEGTD